MSLRTRTDRLLEEVGIERTATLNSDVRALAEAVGLDFTSLPATLAALEADVLGAPAEAAPAPAPAPANEDDTEAGFMAYFGSRRGSAAPAPPVKPEPEPAADSDSDGFELTGSQTEAERTAAARERAERTHDVVDLDGDDDDLAGMGVKALKAVAAARGVDLKGCIEKADMVRAIRAAPADAGPAAAPPRAAPAPEPAAPPPPPQSGQVKRLTRRFISIALKEGASHYDILGVEITVTESDIKIAYRDIAALIHPDKCSEPNASEAFKKVNEANEVLSDAARRAVYDAEQARAAAPAPAPDSQKRRKAPPKRKASKKRKAPRDDDDFIADSDEDEDSEEESEEESDDDDDDDEPARPPPRAPPKRRAPPKTGLEALTVAQLKAKCEAKGLKVSGTKGVLISRLKDAERGVYDRAGERAAPALRPTQHGCLCGVPTQGRATCSARVHRCICGTDVQRHGWNRCVATNGHNCICGKTSHGWKSCIARKHNCICGKDVRGTGWTKCGAPVHNCICGQPSHGWERCVARAHRCICGDDVSGTGWTSCHARPHLCICKLLRAGVAQKNGWTHCGAPFHCRG